jgi:hypothetical protein
MKCDLLGTWVSKAEAKTWPEGIVVVARRTELEMQNWGGVDLDVYFRPDQVDGRYSDSTLFMRLSRKQPGEENSPRRKR